MTELFFYVFAVTAVLSAVLAVSRKNAVASALWLVLMFFALAGTYVLLEAYFVAVIQVLVYAGAIMVLFLFVIMLIDLREQDLARMGPPRMRLAGVLASAVLLAVAVGVVWQTRSLLQAPAAGGPDGSAGAIGDVLFNRWLLAFEVTSVLLLAAIVGAVVLTKRRLT